MASAMSAVRILRDDDAITIIEANSVFKLDPERPVDVLQSVTANDDLTHVELIAEDMLAVRQTNEFGEAQTVMLSPRMASELARILDSVLFVGPTGKTWADGRNLID